MQGVRLGKEQSLSLGVNFPNENPYMEQYIYTGI